MVGRTLVDADSDSLDSDSFNDRVDAWRGADLSLVMDALASAAAAAIAANDANSAEQIGRALLQHDHSAEVGHLARVESCALRGDIAGVESTYFECAKTMRAEFGQRPSARIETAYTKTAGILGSRELTIRYAPTRTGCVAYASWGQGDLPIVCFLGWRKQSRAHA